MKKLFLILLGIVLGVLALSCLTRWDIITTPLGALMAWGAYSAFRAAGRSGAPRAPVASALPREPRVPQDSDRPWQ